MSKLAGLKTLLGWLAGRLVTLIVIGVALWVAYTLGKNVGESRDVDGVTPAPAAVVEEVWTCSMHPEIRLPEPGRCPICGMDLVLDESAPEPAPAAPDAAAEPVGYACAMFCVPPLPHPGKCPVCGMDMVPVYDEPATAGDSERRFAMSEEARALASIETAPVVRRHAVHEVRMVGMIEPDETRLARVTAYVGGRLDRLHVRYTGASVERGAPLAGLYSPELLTARAELIQAKQSAARLSDSSLASVREGAQSTVQAARNRLRLWGLSEAQVRALESGDASDTIITIPSPISGTVLERHVQQGDYVDTGGLIFTVADLSVVWLQLKAYESDLPWIQLDRQVAFTVDAWPGETFTGQVAFIDPLLEGASRTANVRVEVDNRDGRLKPGMFSRARLEAPVAAHDEAPPMLIPHTAPLLTGERAVAYIEVPGQDRPTYEGREIVLGPRTGDYYVVKAGLQENDRVVVRGAFRIDSALQIRSRPSMMHAPAAHDHADMTAVKGDAPAACCSMHAADENHGEALSADVLSALQRLMDAYIQTQQSLAADDWDTGKAGYAAMLEAADAPDESAPDLWIKTLETIQESSRLARETADIKVARRHFQPVSDALLALLDRHPDAPQTPVVRVYCPMAFDDTGAAWLQQGTEVRNPYFGASMLQCGVVQKHYGPSEARE